MQIFAAPSRWAKTAPSIIHLFPSILLFSFLQLPLCHWRIVAAVRSFTSLYNFFILLGLLYIHVLLAKSTSMVHKFITVSKSTPSIVFVDGHSCAADEDDDMQIGDSASGENARTHVSHSHNDICHSFVSPFHVMLSVSQSVNRSFRTINSKRIAFAYCSKVVGHMLVSFVEKSYGVSTRV